MLQNSLFSQEESKFGVNTERYVNAVEQGAELPRDLCSHIWIRKHLEDEEANAQNTKNGRWRMQREKKRRPG